MNGTLLKTLEFSTGRKFVWCRVNVTIEALKLRKICLESQISQKVQWFPFHVLSVQVPKMFLLMKVIATAVLLTTVYLMKKGAYYLFIIIRSWKLVQSFTRDQSILTCSFKIYGKNRMTYWLKLFRKDGSHFKLHIKGRGGGCHSSLSLFPSPFLSPLSLRLRRMKTIFSSKCRFETSEAGFPNVTVDLRTFFYLNSWNNILSFFFFVLLYSNDAVDVVPWLGLVKTINLSHHHKVAARYFGSLADLNWEMRL